MTSDLSSSTMLEPANTSEERAAAVRTVAAAAVDARECEQLLDMLGLDAVDAR